MNAVNGGSFAVTAVHARPRPCEQRAVIDWLLGQEERMGLHTPRPFRSSRSGCSSTGRTCSGWSRALNADGKRVLGYGPPPRGTSLLQFCGFTEQDIPAIAEVNPDKFGCFTPGTGIPIVSEARPGP